MKKILIECECGYTYEAYIEYVSDTTPCSCGCCHGESYTVYFTSCPECKREQEKEI